MVENEARHLVLKVQGSILAARLQIEIGKLEKKAAIVTEAIEEAKKPTALGAPRFPTVMPHALENVNEQITSLKWIVDRIETGETYFLAVQDLHLLGLGVFPNTL